MISKDSIDLVREHFTEQRAVVIGDLMLDEYLFGDVNRISPEAPVPVISIGKRDYRAGGAGNVARNLAALGLNVQIAGFLGQDDAGVKLRQLLEEDGIEVGGIVTLAKPGQTITKTRLIADSQQIVRYDCERESLPDENELNRLSRLIDDILASAPTIVILSDYAKGTLTPQICQQVIARAKAQSFLVYVDPKGTDYSKYHSATAITPNLKELEELMISTGHRHESRQSFAQQQLRELNLERLIVTRGAAGMDAVTATETCHSPAWSRDVYDVSGAGDTAIGILAACHASGMNIPDTLAVANTTSGIAVQKIGAVAVYRDEVLEALGQAEGGNLAGALSLDRLLKRVAEWRKDGDQIVFTNGCFDMLHAGHISLLHAAARQGTRLIVALNSDCSTRKLKGPERPYVDETDRASLVAALTCVDAVTLFDEPEPLKLILALRPDVLVKGADYAPEEIVGYQQVKAYDGKVVVIPLAEGKSTSRLAETIRERRFLRSVDSPSLERHF